MRPVNLLPERYRPAQATGRLRGSSYVAVAVLGVLLLMVLGYVLTNNSINNTKEDTNQAVAEAQEAEARAAALGAFGDFQQIKATREAAVKQLAQNRFDYERLMREVALVLPDDVFLTTFNALPSATVGAATPAAASAPDLTVGGCAADHPSVADTVVRLRKLHNATDVVLITSTKADVAETGGAGEGGCRVAWEAKVIFEPETAQETRPSVPARLGGGA